MDSVTAIGQQQRLGQKTVLFTDMVGSTRLKQVLGDRKAVEMMQAHHALVRKTLSLFPHGREVETAGDSFLLLFTEPLAAVEFALMLHASLRSFSVANDRVIFDRIGIHRGEIYSQVHENQVKLFGMHVDIAARVMSLAVGGQILMSREVFDIARQTLRHTDLRGITEVAWMAHGPYQVKGVEDPVEICEVGECRLAPLKPPASPSLAARQVAPEDEKALGWRPAVGLRVPGTSWVLQQKVGEGGFAEVWLGEDPGNDERVFKFCFQLDRVRALKREVTLFGLMRERIGEHRNIVKLLEVHFDEPPFYLAEEYIPGKDLKSWCQEKGGAENVVLATRLEIVAQAAEGLQAAHDAGVLHRDVKPGNILICERESLCVKLSDFGVGQVTSDDSLGGLTRAGFTLTLISGGSSQTGTHVYMAPELYAGKPASIRSDVYSLGILFYQLLVGDFSQPLSSEWPEQITDPLLQEDLRRCIARNASDRFDSAGHLAKSLRSLESRRAASALHNAALAARERAAYRRGLLRSAAIAAVIVAAMAMLALLAWRNGQESQSRLAKLNLDSGIRLMQEGDLLGALPWLVEALSLDKQKSPQSKVGRIRIASVLRQAPKLVQVWPHKDMVTSADFSSRGQVLTACRDGTVQVWDRNTGKRVIPALQLGQSVYYAAFSPDGNRLVTCSADQAARIWDARTGAQIGAGMDHSTRNRQDANISASFSPDGSLVVSCGGNGVIHLTKTDDGLDKLEPIRHPVPLTFVKFSPSGDRFAVGGSDGTFWIHDAKTGTTLISQQGHQAAINYLTFSPDGRSLVTCSEDSTGQVWDTQTGQPIGARLYHGRALLTADFSPDGQRVVTSSYDRTARLWDAKTGAPVMHPFRHLHSVVQATFSPDGQYVLTSSHDQTAKLWDVVTGESVLTLKHNGFVLWSSFAPDSHEILTAGQDGMAKLWDIAGALCTFPPVQEGKEITAICFSPDGKLVATGEDGSIALWQTATGKLVVKLHQQGRLNTIAFSADGHKLVTAGQDHTARIWSIPQGTSIGSSLQHDAPVNCASFSSDGRYVITGCENGVARVWDANTGSLQPIEFKQGGAIKCAAFSPDSKKVATGGWDSTVKIWDLATGQLLIPPLVHPAEVRHFAFSADGKKIVTACADAFDPILFPARNGQMWEVATGKPLGKPLHHSDGVLWAEFSPDGRLVVTTSEDGTARIWDATSGAPVQEPLRHNWQVVRAQFSADSRSLLTIGRDGAARLWDTSSGDPAIPVLRHANWEIQGTLSPDGRCIATATSSGGLFVWSLPDDSSPVGDLELLAQVLTGQRFKPLAGSTLISAHELETEWQHERAARPAYFARSQSELSVWHALQLENCLRHDLWRGSLFHLNQLIAFEPKNSRFRVQCAKIMCDHSLWADAVSQLGKVPDNEALSASTYLMLAHAHLALTNDLAALEAYQHAIALAETTRDISSSELKQAHLQRSVLLERHHRFDEALQDKLRAMGVPGRDPNANAEQLDLDKYYNCGLDEDLHGIAGNTFSALPKGLQRLGTIEFDLRGIVQLANHGPLEKIRPSQVSGISAGQKCRRVHFLHATGWGSSISPGTVIGKYVLHFEGGLTENIDIRYGQDVLDWWGEPLRDDKPNPAKVAWSGKNDSSAIRLFETDWENPHPDLALMSLDFVSAIGPGAPFLVAVTLE